MHNDNTLDRSGAGGWADRAGPAAAGVAAAAVAIAPRSSQLAYLVLAAVPISGLMLAGGWRRRLTIEPLTLALIAFGAYLAVNAAWSVDRLEAYGKVAWFWLLAASGVVAVAGLAGLDEERLRRTAAALLAGLAVATLFVMIESAFQQPIKRLIYSVLPFARPSPKHVRVADGAVTQIGHYVLNRNLAVICLALWPALLMLRSLLPAHLLRPAAAAAGLAVLVAVAASEHETSMLALAGSTLAFAGLLIAAPLTRGLIRAGWLAATLLVVPIAAASYDAGLHQARWIPETGRNRIILWGFTAGEVRKAPLLGIGVASTKELDELAAPSAQRPGDHSYPLRTGRHSHNIFLQTWYELGAVGAVLLAAIGWIGLGWLSRLPPAIAPYAYASLVAAVLIGAFSWGMWQTWFMAAYAMWVLWLVLAIELARRVSPRPAFA